MVTSRLSLLLFNPWTSVLLLDPTTSILSPMLLQRCATSLAYPLSLYIIVCQSLSEHSLPQGDKYQALYFCLIAYAKTAYAKTVLLPPACIRTITFRLGVRKNHFFLRTKANSWYSCLPFVRKVLDHNALVYWTFTPTQKLA